MEVKSLSAVADAGRCKTVSLAITNFGSRGSDKADGRLALNDSLRIRGENSENGGDPCTSTN